MFKTKTSNILEQSE